MGIMSALELLLTRHFIALVLIVIYGMKLHIHKETRDAELRYFWVAVVCCFLLVIEDVAETACAMDPDLRFFRILFSVIGYALRPIAAVGLLLVVCPPKYRTWKTWLPALVNLAVYATAFFSPIAFSFNEEYEFVRGPLGYCVFVVALLYMLLVLAMAWHRFHERNKAERWIMYICAASCIIAAVIDSIHGSCRVIEAIMISGVFFYIFLRSHDNRLDPLTSLENRFAFYEDVKHWGKSVSAVASIDMNGLKRINDTKGHPEGDRALVEIGRCLSRVNGRDAVAYRIGGDEFLIVFLQQGRPFVEQTVKQVREDVNGAGYSISIGYAMRTHGESAEDALMKSDRAMYEDKAAYYQQADHDRRSTQRRHKNA
ncbi:MAG: GGDEF domain-containing protein [Clostridia bacterium]|nr:GGDEF domain-containing protein [Clostridia bacterium]